MPQLHDDPEAGHREHAPPLCAGGARGGAGHLIREVGLEDCDALARVHAACFAEDWSAASLAALMEGGSVALAAGEEAFVLVRVAADEAEILTLAVVPGARRRGLATALLTAALAAAQARGAGKMFLEVSAENAPARALYSRAGFHETARRTRYYRDGSDALVLSRTLA